MSQTVVSNKARRFATGILCLVMAFLLFQSESVFAGGLKFGWHKGKSKRNPAPVMSTTSESSIAAASAASAETIVPLATSNVPKLFWFDCGFSEDCTDASLYYVDPAATTKTPVKFAAGVMVHGSDWNKDDNAIVTGSINQTNYTITNAKIVYVVYFKKNAQTQKYEIWKVDTTTLAATRVSNEVSIGSSPGWNSVTNGLCRFETLDDWQNPLNSTIYYELAGPDGWCWSGDEVRKAVKLGMSPTAAPITVGKKNVMELLFDGRFIVEDWSTGTHIIKICNSSIAGCANITTRQNTEISWWTEGFDATRVIFNLDGKLMSYNFSTTPGTLKTLYTPAAGEGLAASRLDKDGFVYFATVKNTANAIKKVPASGGAVTTLTTFTTTMQLEELELDLSPSYLVYYYPNTTFSAGLVYSVPKAGGTPVLLSNAFVTGGAIGQYLYYEDTSGNVNRKNLNGTGLVSKPNSQLIGITLGGTADWFYMINPTTFRGLVAGIDNQVRSYAYADNISTAPGVLLGTIPVNLSNANGMGMGNDMLLQAGKRGDWFSFGSDILFMNASTPTSLKRITNTNGEKEVIMGID